MARVESHAIYGRGGAWFGRGVRDLDGVLDDLSPVWDCSLWSRTEEDKITNGIIARQKRYGDRPIIIFITHSDGCRVGMNIAWRLNAKGIVVSYIAAIDPTALVWPWGSRIGPPMLASHNIDKVDEFWATSGAPAWARKRDPSGGDGGRYIYPDNWQGKGRIPIPIPGGHVACASNPKTRAVILASVKAVLK